MILSERNSRKEQALWVARQMMTSARTAPKGKGFDIVEIATVYGEEIEILAEETEQLAEETGLQFLLRDAENIRKADAILIIGTTEKCHGLNCAHCGFQTCQEKPSSVPCAINTIDVGIAIGSACACAADLRVDSRVMFSVGLAAQKMDILSGCKQVIAIPISISSKNPFFDRPSQEK